MSDRIVLIRRWSDSWAAGTEFVYGMFIGEAVVGGAGLHDRVGPDAFEIGYWVRASHINQGIASSTARLLTEAAFAVPYIRYVEIHHDKANIASGRILQKLGFTLIREVPDDAVAPGEIGVSCEWKLSRASPVV